MYAVLIDRTRGAVGVLKYRKLKFSTKYFSTATSLCILREKIQQNDNSLAQETGQHRDEMLILLLAPKKQSI